MVHQAQKKSSALSSAVIPSVESTALLSRNSGSSQTSGSRNFKSGKKSGFLKGVFYNYCGIEGHIEDRCFRKHGFPEGFKFTKSKPNIANNVSSDGQLLNQSINGNSPDVPVTQDQFQQLLALIAKSG